MNNFVVIISGTSGGSSSGSFVSNSTIVIISITLFPNRWNLVEDDLYRYGRSPTEGTFPSRYVRPETSSGRLKVCGSPQTLRR